MAPETRYARSGDVSIAYQVFGDGPFDIVVSLPASCHVELAWEAPTMRAYFERLASFARVINFDKRGVGLSDKSAGYSSPETRMDDIRAVMDAAGSRGRPCTRSGSGVMSGGELFFRRLAAQAGAQLAGAAAVASTCPVNLRLAACFRDSTCATAG